MPFPERTTSVSFPRPPFRVAVAQVEPTLGNMPVNLKIHLDAIDAAKADGADLLVFPELSMTGYYLRDQVPEVAEARGRAALAGDPRGGGKSGRRLWVRRGEPLGPVL